MERKSLLVRCNESALNKELVFALGRDGGFFFHGLQHDFEDLSAPIATMARNAYRIRQRSRLVLFSQSWGERSTAWRWLECMEKHRELLSLTFGAVVLTLNATGCALLFVTVSVRLTSTVRGPAMVVNK